MTINDKKYYIRIDGKSIEVDEELYRAYYRPIWRTRYHAQQNGECICTKGQLYKCDGVCPGCPFHTESKVTSLDNPIAGEDEEITLGDIIESDTAAPDEIAMETILLEALYAELDRLDPEGKRICELLMHHSEREAADIMGMPRSTFKRHWAKVQALLKDRLKDFYY